MQNYLSKAQTAHKNFYDYSKVAFNSTADKVTITCPKHGDFQQSLYRHIRGAGCKKCEYDKRSKLFRLPISEFLERSKIIHDDKYDYSKVSYTNSRDRVTIICPKHGEFEQIVSGHLTGYGCRNCAVESKFSNNEEFVRRCRAKHNSYYDYSKVVYTDSRNKVTIICPNHGEFEQIAAAHQLGSKCPKCSREDRYLTTDKFIAKSREVHRDLYDYSNVNYKGVKTKVWITCPKHGDFEQTPNSHLNGAGCPGCRSSKGEIIIEEILTDSGVAYIKEYKIPEVNTKHRYDFYLPDYRVLIEFHGIQHFQPVDFFGGRDAFIYTRQNDQFKRMIASDLKYTLIEFNYKQLDTLSKQQFQKLVLKTLAIIGK